MSTIIKRRCAVSIVSLFHLLTVTLVAIPNTVWAQADMEPPVIELELEAEGVRGDTQVFSAKITDDTSVGNATLYYRYKGSKKYTPVEMERVPNSKVFTASIDPGPDRAKYVEYYLEATDKAGNRTLQGFSFDPIKRMMVKYGSLGSTTSSGSGFGSLSTGRKIAYGVIGILVVGAIAAAASSDDGPSGVPTVIIVE